MLNQCLLLLTKMLFKVILSLCLYQVYSLRLERPDETDLYRPCRFNDLKCVCQEMQERGWCPQTEFPADILKVDKIIIPLPYFNFTFIMTDNTFEGLHRGEVTEFYLNKKTNKAVIMFDFRDVIINSSALFKFHRQGREDIILDAPTREVYRSFSISNTIDGLTKHDEHKYDAHAFYPTLPVYTVGNLDLVTDPVVLGTFVQLNLELGVGISEAFAYRTPYIARYFANILCYKNKL